LREFRILTCETEFITQKGFQNLLGQEPCNGAERDSRVKFGKEAVTGAHRRPKWVPHYSVQADSGRAQNTQACSPSAQVKAAVAHVRRLKRNQRQ